MNVVNVPENLRNMVDSPSYACPVPTSLTPVDSTDESDPASTSPTPASESGCNVSVCTVDSDCCSGSCRPYGRCSNIDAGFDANSGVQLMFQKSRGVSLFVASCLLIALV